MPELIEELRRLAFLWAGHANGMNAGDAMTRESGYASGLRVCAKQLISELDRIANEL